MVATTIAGGPSIGINLRAGALALAAGLSPRAAAVHEAGERSGTRVTSADIGAAWLTVILAGTALLAISAS